MNKEDKKLAVEEPFLIKSQDEFVKYIFLFSTCLPGMILENEFGDKISDDAEMIAYLMKVILHDYHALVMKGIVTPYEFYCKDENGNSLPFDNNEMRKGFEKVLKECTMALAMNGVPTKETDDGRLETDYDEMVRRVRERMEKGEQQ